MIQLFKKLKSLCNDRSSTIVDDIRFTQADDAAARAVCHALLTSIDGSMLLTRVSRSPNSSAEFLVCKDGTGYRSVGRASTDLVKGYLAGSARYDQTRNRIVLIRKDVLSCLLGVYNAIGTDVE